MIINPGLTAEKREQFSKIIRESGDQLISIVNDIMIIAAIESGQEKPQENETNINLLLQVLKNQNIDKAESKNLSFTVTSELSGDEAIVLVDEAKLLQILANLTSNAIKFTNEGSIKVNCRLEGSYLLFAVKDTGIGIPPEMHQKIFDRFFQIDYSETRLYGGTGLGLTVVKSYVHFLKGEVHLDSIPGEGSTFYFTIPYVPVKKEDRSVEIAIELKKGDLSDAVILVAEDDDNNYLYLEEILLDKKLKIIRAKNGQEAVRLCKTHPEIELVLMDIKIPLLDGLEATKEIHKFRKNLPVIAQTAYAFLNDREKALNSGCVDFLSKPFEKELLYTKIIEQLNKMSISDS
jgi:CheY-like chemotaxis protein/two-component sensor histidine kinase